MKSLRFLCLFLFTAVIGSSPAWSYKLLYAEQFYKLYTRHLYEYPEDILENVHFLGMALRSDFANPLNALARIETKKEWEKYRYLFYMHVNLKLLELHLQLANGFDKYKAYFFNYPWKEENLKSLKTAEELYEYSRNFWKEAQYWSKKAGNKSFRYINLKKIQFWEDENARIESGSLDYNAIIDKHLKRLRKVRKDFEAMDQNTY